jgi:APA family basic amino acid/polyamine antiporter
MNTLNVNFLVMPRVAFGLSRDGMPPAAFTRDNKRGTPCPALIFATAMILALTVTGAFVMLIRFYMLIVIALDLLVFVGLFRLRRLHPDLPRPFKVPLYPWLPLLTIMLYTIIVGALVIPQPRIALASGLTVVVLVVSGILTVRRRDRATTSAPLTERT